MSQKNKQKDYNLNDFIWEEEEFKFEPKVNRHRKFLHAKKRQLEKERYANTKDIVISFEHEIYETKRQDAEKRLAYEDYDFDDEDFTGYRIK